MNFLFTLFQKWNFCCLLPEAKNGKNESISQKKYSKMKEVENWIAYINIVLSKEKKQKSYVYFNSSNHVQEDLNTTHF